MVGVADRGDVIVPGKIAFESRSADELNNDASITMSYLEAARVAMRPNSMLDKQMPKRALQGPVSCRGHRCPRACVAPIRTTG
jgi:hypothetical protein